jgi:hypothetical protein
MDHDTKRRFVPALIGAALLAAVPAVAEPLTVRINDAMGVPGGTVALVMRTYASRPIGQGQFCLQAAPTLPLEPDPITAILGAEVFSVVPDVTSNVTDLLTMDPPTVVLDFISPSVTVNATDGPLAVVFMQLSPDVVPGQSYDLVLDLANTVLIDGDGLPIEVTPRNGTLTIRAPEAPRSASAGAEDAVPGDDALLAFETNELYPIASGQVALEYDPSWSTGPPVVTMNPLHGNAVFTADTATPGRVVVDFSSADTSLNSIPGSLIEVRVPTSAAVPVGTVSPVTLDESATWLLDELGQPIPLEFDTDVLNFVALEPPSPGATSQLRVSRSESGLFLDWQADCGDGQFYAIYRGNLTEGYASIAPEPGRCAVAATSAELPLGPGSADFFLVAPVLDGLEGSPGNRPDPGAACHPRGDTNDCAE